MILDISVPKKGQQPSKGQRRAKTPNKGHVLRTFEHVEGDDLALMYKH